MNGTFYTVVRFYYVGETETHFVDHFQNYDDALVRHYKNIATDLDRQGCVYNASYVVDSNGNRLEWKVFDRRHAETPEA